MVSEPRMHIISENPAVRAHTFECQTENFRLNFRLKNDDFLQDAARGLKPKIEGLVSQQYELAPAKESLEQYRKLQGERGAILAPILSRPSHFSIAKVTFVALNSLTSTRVLGSFSGSYVSQSSRSGWTVPAVRRPVQSFRLQTWERST